MSEDKTKSKDKKESVGLGDKLRHLFLEYKNEYGKIIWPKRADLIRQTFAVLVVCLVFGVVISGFDYLFTAGYQFLMRLV